MPPNVLPALLTPSLLTSIRRQPHLPRHTWYFVTAVTLSALNRPDEIARVFQHALENGPGPEDRRPGPDEQLTMARKTREALIKSAAIAGLPKVRIPRSLGSFLESDPARGTLSIANQPRRPGHQRAVRAQGRHAGEPARRAAGLLAHGQVRRRARRALVYGPAPRPGLLRQDIRQGFQTCHGPDGSVGHRRSGPDGEATLRLHPEQYERAVRGREQFRAAGGSHTAGCLA